MYERADLVADLALVDRGTDAIVVRDAAGTLLAWALVVHRRSRWADVHPDARGRGIGRALVDWSVAVARAAGTDRIGQTIEDGRADAEALFRAVGAVPIRTSWILRRSHDPAGPPPALAGAAPPPGIVLRSSTPADADLALDVMESAFRQWPDRLPATRETWRALVTGREGFRHDQLQVAVDGTGAIVGAAFLVDDGTELWVDKLATRPDAQGRGIGRALLAHAFVLAHARGRASTALSTDSTTGALPFYERLGMRVERAFTHWAVPLAGPGPAPEGRATG